MKYYRNENKSSGSGEFILGIVLLVIGLFIFTKKVYVHHDWITFRIGSMDLSNGLVTLPLLIGIVWQFYKPKSSGSKLLILLGTLIIIISILMSIRISFVGTSLFDYLLMFGFIAAGAGILLKTFSNQR